MSRFEPSDYAALDISGRYYPEWEMNTSIALKSRCIIEGNVSLKEMMKLKVKSIEP
ncbi:unnamed protein product [Brassica oleracea var. botrytis]